MYCTIWGTTIQCHTLHCGNVVGSICDTTCIVFLPYLTRVILYLQTCKGSNERVLPTLNLLSHSQTQTRKVGDLHFENGGARVWVWLCETTISLSVPLPYGPMYPFHGFPIELCMYAFQCVNDCWYCTICIVAHSLYISGC